MSLVSSASEEEILATKAVAPAELLLFELA
jgi:hypothetical protein